jgi:MarR family 2-MHQ and catechol resistance regulon transcriptional repressor
MGTHYKGTPEEVRALNAFISLLRATESVVRRLARALAESGLTTSQFGVLECLHHLGPMHIRDISRKLLKTSGNITLVIDNLEKRGYVKRRPGGKDRRYVTVTLTGEGEELISSIFPAHAETITREMQVLSPKEQETLRELCKRLGKRYPLEGGP